MLLLDFAMPEKNYTALCLQLRNEKKHNLHQSVSLSFPGRGCPLVQQIFALNPSLAMTTQRGVRYLEGEMFQPLLTWHTGKHLLIDSCLHNNIMEFVRRKICTNFSERQSCYCRIQEYSTVFGAVAMRAPWLCVRGVLFLHYLEGEMLEPLLTWHRGYFSFVASVPWFHLHWPCRTCMAM